MLGAWKLNPDKVCKAGHQYVHATATTMSGVFSFMANESRCLVVGYAVLDHIVAIRRAYGSTADPDCRHSERLDLEFSPSRSLFIPQRARRTTPDRSNGYHQGWEPSERLTLQARRTSRPHRTDEHPRTRQADTMPGPTYSDTSLG